MNKILDKKYEYLNNFFKTAIEQDKLFHSIIFHGNNIYIQYAMALELARQLNCTGDKSEDCQCQNCRWIRNNQHPAVMTISKINNKSDSSKTVISVKQVSEILDTLINSSNYHRFFIFCDADIKQLSNKEKEEYSEFISTGFKTPEDTKDKETDSKLWCPSGINYKIFESEVANSMLKSIEEPPKNVTFIFLTENKEDLISTIVSRSQAFCIADNKKENYDYSFLKDYFQDYPTFNKGNVFKMVDALLKHQSTNDLMPNFVIDSIQAYLADILKANTQNPSLTKIILKDIEKMEEYKHMLKSHVKENTVYEDLSFYFAKR